MAKRHRMRAGDWESIFGRLQELVMANSGEDPFDEIFKLLIVKLFAERHPRTPGPFGEASRSAHALAQEFNKTLCQAVDAWKGIISSPARSHLADEHLAVCIDALRGVSLSDTALEVMDGAFEYLVSHVSKGAKGQYFTPRHIVELCIQILNPRSSEMILDPACGSGGFLVHTLNHVQRHSPGIQLKRYGSNLLWGCDFDNRAVQVAKALMLIAGAGDANLYRLNSLLTPAANLQLMPEKGTDVPRMTIEDVLRARSGVKGWKGFDIVVTNPPFAGEIKEDALLQSYSLSRAGRRMERDVLFLERCVQLLRPGGRLCIVLPHNKLGGSSWAYVREWLLRRIQVVAVLGLGRHSFLPHTHQKTCIIFGLKRERVVAPPFREEALFLISEKDGKDSRGQIVTRAGAAPDAPAWERADHDLDELVRVFREFVKSHHIPWENGDATAHRTFA